MAHWLPKIKERGYIQVQQNGKYSYLELEDILSSTYQMYHIRNKNFGYAKASVCQEKVYDADCRSGTLGLYSIKFNLYRPDGSVYDLDQKKEMPADQVLHPRHRVLAMNRSLRFTLSEEELCLENLKAKFDHMPVKAPKTHKELKLILAGFRTGNIAGMATQLQAADNIQRSWDAEKLALKKEVQEVNDKLESFMKKTKSDLKHNKAKTGVQDQVNQALVD